MTDTYSKHAAICAEFYRLNLDSEAVAEFVATRLRPAPGQRVLFVGGMFEIAGRLSQQELNLTVVDYSSEMVALGSSLLPGARVLQADLRSLPFKSEFDFVVVIGRVFTHMLTDQDARAAIESCRAALVPGGKLLADNYESSKIEVTPYFNGEVVCEQGDTRIIRRSTTTRLSEQPRVVLWNAEYEGNFCGKPFLFSDSIEHRAFDRAEFAQMLRNGGFEVVEQGDNFEETSFYSLAAVSRG